MSAPTRYCIGFIGLGAMGAPMAANLARAGYPLWLWNRSPDRARDLAAELRGLAVACAPDPASLAATVDLIITCVSADADLAAVISALLPGLRPGSRLVDCSTVAPACAREQGARIAAAGGRFLDAPVSGGVEGARAADLVMMVGGDPASFAELQPVFAAISRRQALMGPVGAGQASKAVNQIMAAGINQAVTEALAFGEAQGLPMPALIDLLSAGAAGNWFLQHRGHSMTRGRYAPGFKVNLHAKDLAICRAAAAELGVALPLVEMTLLHYRRLIDQGHGDEDISALYRTKRALLRQGRLPAEPAEPD